MPELDQRSSTTLPGPDAGKTDVVHWDDALPGFGLRCWSSGKRVWIVRYRLGTRQRVVTIATTAEITAAKARKKAGDILAGRRLGDDERHKIERRKTEAAATTERTLADLITAYREHVIGRQKPRTRIETNRHLDKHWLPLHRLPLSRIDRATVAGRLLELAKASGPVAANRARAALSAVFAWGMGAGLAEHNPVAGTVRNDETSRDRVLTGDELRAVWRATDGAGHFDAIVRLLMLTGQRREEVAAIGWSEVDLDRAVWTLPAVRAKNGRAHGVPLSDQAVAILRAIGRREGRDLIFGEGRGGFSGWSQSKRRLDRRTAALAGRELSGWTLHDLRRTAVTGMAEIGIQPHVIEAVVNHVSGHKGGIAGVYNRATYAAEKRAALQAWADHVLRLAAD